MRLPRTNLALLIAAAVLLTVAGPSAASEPTLWHYSDGWQPYVLPDTAEVVWLREPDLDGNAASSEVMSEFGYETEVADDFILSEMTTVTGVRWWGKYWNGFEEPFIAGFNLRFYENNGCFPGELLAEIIIPYNCLETEIVFGTYEYHTEIPPFDVHAGGHAWLSIQAADHEFLGQWGRLQSVYVVECDAAFRSEYFSYPDWVYLGIPEPWDASFALYSGEWEGEACCFEDGYCAVTPVETCLNHGGTPQGPDSDCDPNLCPQPPPQACCFADGSCQMLTDWYCAYIEGIPQGELSTCEPNPCAQPAACCFDDGTCEMFPDWVCTDAGGRPQGEGIACDPDPCAELLEACCFRSGACERLFADVCLSQSGEPQGLGTVCDPNPCFGACCFYNDECQIISLYWCDPMGGEFMGGGTDCDPNPCLPEACCFNDGTCLMLDESECLDQDGDPQGAGTDCEPNRCAPVSTETTSWGLIKALYWR